MGDPADVGLGDAVDTRQGAWSGEVDLNSGKAAGTVSDTLDNLAEAVKDDLKVGETLVVLFVIGTADIIVDMHHVSNRLPY